MGVETRQESLGTSGGHVGKYKQDQAGIIPTGSLSFLRTLEDCLKTYNGSFNVAAEVYIYCTLNEHSGMAFT